MPKTNELKRKSHYDSMDSGQYADFSEDGLRGFIERLKLRINQERSFKKPNEVILNEAKLLFQLAEDCRTKHITYRKAEKKWITNYNRFVAQPDNQDSNSIEKQFTPAKTEKFHKLQSQWLEADTRLKDEWVKSSLKKEEVIEAQKKIEHRVKSGTTGGKASTSRWHTLGVYWFVRELVAKADPIDASKKELWGKALDWADTGGWEGCFDKERDLYISIKISDQGNKLVFRSSRGGETIAYQPIGFDAFRKAVKKEDKRIGHPTRHRGR